MGGKASRMGERIQESAGKAHEALSGRSACEHQPQHKQYSVPPKSPELNEKDFSFLKEQTGKSEDDIKRLFDKYGLNKKDSRLDKKNFIELYKEMHPDSKDYVNEVADHVFRAFDSDCTGYIEFNEFMVAYALTSKGDTQKKFDYAFDLYDVNHNGSLEQNELRSVVTGMCDLLGVDRRYDNPQRVIDNCVRELSPKEGGKVNKDEFINGLIKNEDINCLMKPFSEGKPPSACGTKKESKTQEQQTEREQGEQQERRKREQQEQEQREREQQQQQQQQQQQTPLTQQQ